VEKEYLNWALTGFSGYIAADELYDGPFCVLSIVDNRTFRRLMYEVLDHKPGKDDIESFFMRFKAQLDQRGLKTLGITTDGSPLYPDPIKKVFGDVSHQICEFHVIAELTKAILRGVAKVRKALTAQMPPVPRGRPGTVQAKQAVTKKKRLQSKVKDLFEYRHLFVQHDLTTAERKTLARISGGKRQLRTLRRIMDEVYQLFDRRCRTQTALAKLQKLRRRAKRFQKVGKVLQKLFHPNLEKALTFLNDKFLPSTSNAVERGNRRHRKMQKTIYCARKHHTLVGRMALDLVRDQQAQGRGQTIISLHQSRPRKMVPRKNSCFLCISSALGHINRQAHKATG
jgi:hypothetical protein